MGNTSLDNILDATISSKSASDIKPKRGNSTHLSALTRVAKAQDDPAEADIVEIDPHLIDFSPEINHREQGWLSEENKGFLKLVHSVEKNGQKIPIMVQSKGEGRYELVYGSRRRQVAINLKRNVRAIIANGITDTDAHTLALMENQNNEGLSPIEEARAVLAYKEKHSPISDIDVASVFSKSRQWVNYQNSLANIDPLFIERCSNPWTITEKGSREFRKLWNSQAKTREKWKKMLRSLVKKQSKLPFKLLLEHLYDEEHAKKEPTQIKNKDGSIAAQVKEVQRKGGKNVRWVCLHESFDKAAVNKLITVLDKDFESDLEQDQ